MGRIHTSGRIPQRGLVRDIEWNIVGNTIADLSENELEIWYEAQDRFKVMVKPPDDRWIGPVQPGSYIENQQLKDKSFVSIYNELYHPQNGCNLISIYLSPFLGKKGCAGISAGRWLVRLEGKDIRDGHFHGWIERDDPRHIGRLGPKGAWRFPSYFTERSNVDNSSVNSLACGRSVIAVANLDSENNILNVTSSQGPTRDGRAKPDVCAPGTGIVAAKGFSKPGDLWVEMSGTSMASPYVAGVVGLMLAEERNLTAAQILGIIKRTASPLPGADYDWCNDAGFGEIQARKCVREVKDVFGGRDLAR